MLQILFQQEMHCLSEEVQKKMESWVCWGGSFSPDDLVILESHPKGCFRSDKQLQQWSFSPAALHLQEISSFSCALSSHLWSQTPCSTSAEHQARLLKLDRSPAPMLWQTGQEGSSQVNLPFKPCLRQCSITTKNCKKRCIVRVQCPAQIKRWFDQPFDTQFCHVHQVHAFISHEIIRIYRKQKKNTGE